MKKGLFAGTFDPPTLGHLNIIQRAAALCGTLCVGIAQNSAKGSPIFSAEQRLEMLKLITKDIPHVEIAIFQGLAVDFAKKQGVDFFIRGLRNCTDLEYEGQMAFTNRQIAGIETVFLLSDERYTQINSTLIREIAVLGRRRLKDFIPAEIEDIVFKGEMNF